MPPGWKNAVGALAVSLVALVAAGCGGSEEPRLIPPEDATALLELLDQAEKRFDDGSCDDLRSTLTQLDRGADGLPDAEVDVGLRKTLNAEIVELEELAAKCKPEEEEVVVPEPVAPAPTVVPETTAPAPVEPPTTVQEPETETEAEEKPPPSEEPPKPPQESPQEPAEPPAPQEPPGGDPCQNNSPVC